MELEWSTFLLEIANFLVLAWLLERFLFKPVLKVIGERQAGLDATAARTHEKERAAEHLAQDYGQRLVHWEQEKEKLRQQLREELGVERERRLTQLDADLTEERMRQQTVAERAAHEAAFVAERGAVSQAAAFAARLLQRVSSPDLERKLIDAAVEDLRAVDDIRRSEIGTALRENGCKVHVTTAFDLTAESKSVLEAALAQLGQGNPTFMYDRDASVLAGLRVSIGPWMLRANLADELQAFSDAAGLTH